MEMTFKQATQAVRTYIRANLTDRRLAEVYAFNQDGKMAFADPCGCLMGVTLAEQLHTGKTTVCTGKHYEKARMLDTGQGLYILRSFGSAEWGYNILNNKLGVEASTRKMSAVLRAEIRRRDRIAQAKRDMQEWFDEPVAELVPVRSLH